MNNAVDFDPAAFIQNETHIASPSLLPELKLHLAGEVTPLWQITEARLKSGNIPPPFWAFAWPGGQGVARYLLDHPEAAHGKRVLDFAAGSGVAALAAMKAGAQQALAVDIDFLALHAITLNATLNQTQIDTAETFDTSKAPKKIDLILVGDVCYQQAMAASLMRWLWLCVTASIRVIMGDPGRAYVPHSGLTELATYIVPTSHDLESADSRMVKVWDVGLPKDED